MRFLSNSSWTCVVIVVLRIPEAFIIRYHHPHRDWIAESVVAGLEVYLKLDDERPRVVPGWAGQLFFDGWIIGQGIISKDLSVQFIRTAVANPQCYSRGFPSL